MKETYNESIDIAKGIGMICLVLGHLFIIGSDSFKMIFAFHMPLFFFLSGFLFIPSKYPPKKFFQSKIGKLVLTYLLFVIIGTIFHAIFYEIHLKGLLISVFYRGEPYVASALWFITVLSIIWIISYCVPGILENKINRWLYLLLISALCLSASYLFSISPQKIQNYLPLKLGSLPLSFLFFYFGFFCQTFEIQKPKYYMLTLLVGGVSC